MLRQGEIVNFLRISERDGQTILHGNRVVETRDIIWIVNQYLEKPCSQCFHPRYEHVEDFKLDKPIYCCDGCNGYKE